jgi:hypothetical protein
MARSQSAVGSPSGSRGRSSVRWPGGARLATSVATGGTRLATDWRATAAGKYGRAKIKVIKSI